MAKWEDIVKALENNKYRWRTVRGVAKELKTTDKQILELIQQHADEVIKSSIPADTGEDLLTTRNHYRRTASPYAKIISSVTQSVSGTDSSSIVSTVILPKNKEKGVRQ
jgi:phenylpropionate dioxygenase-like ring-hydroxylating dioxygenase large terminal subunit